MKTKTFLFLLSFLGISQLSYAQEAVDSTDKIYEIEEVSEEPQFPGGADAMKPFIGKNIRYTEVALKKHLQGTVYVEFVIEIDGSVTQVKVISDIGGGLGAEALRVVRLMPKWESGKLNEVPVRVRMEIPVKFRLN